ncbi:hypothetical protein GGR54DRAFT_590433 [Hypoxylon sp. NC1633]|nr:hypothetical protein GGR54DRAFT_590433 [Hypoxylon sp. NC1633]
MSQKSVKSPVATGHRRSSTSSEKTLVDKSGGKLDFMVKEKDISDDVESYLSTSSTKDGTSSSTVPSFMEKAMRKVKSTFGEKDSKPTPKHKRPEFDSYPDTVYMWRSLAETRI